VRRADPKERTLKPSPTRVLIIDDDPLIRQLLVSALRKDCLVAVASEGSEGFYKALEMTPDLAVIDVNMPGWDGLKTLEAFRAHPALKSVKIIMLTADSSKQTVMAAIHGGAHDYVIKTTFSKADFYRKVNRLIPGSVASVGPLVVEFEADQASAAGALVPISESTDAETGERHLASASNRQDACGSAVAVPVLSTTATAANIESRLQELIDGWE
jgi:DNA-binding response OmpR family regulator